MVTIHLQICLPKLKLLLLGLGQRGNLIVRKRIGPLENPTTLNDCRTGDAQKFKLLGRVALNFMQGHNFLFKDRFELLGEFSRLFVICVSFILEHVPLQLHFGLFSLLFLLRKFFIFFLHLFELVTFVVATRGRPMIFPIFQTNPAELVFANLTDHMVAPLILFDGSDTFGAVFRVCRDPNHIFRFGRIFDVPLFCDLTRARFVRKSSASKAKRGSTLARNILGPLRGEGAFETVFAAGLRTPPYRFVIIRETFAEPLPVHFFEVGCRC